MTRGVGSILVKTVFCKGLSMGTPMPDDIRIVLDFGPAPLSQTLRQIQNMASTSELRVKIAVSTTPGGVRVGNKAHKGKGVPSSDEKTGSGAGRARSKPLSLNLISVNNSDFLSRLEDAEARDTERSLTQSRPVSPDRSPAVPVPPIPVPPVAPLSKSSSRCTPHVDRPTSARSTPRPSPHPSTPRAPRATRMPKCDSPMEGLVAVSFDLGPPSVRK